MGRAPGPGNMNKDELIGHSNRLAKKLKAADERIAALEQRLAKLGAQTDTLTGEAKAAEAEKNAVLKEMKALKQSVREQDPVGKGAYEIRTKNEQTILGRTRPAGTLIGYFTTIEGMEPISLAHALYYSTASVHEADAGELYTELMSKAQAAGDAVEIGQELAAAKETVDGANAHCADLENAIEDLNAEIAALKEAAGKGGKAGEKTGGKVSEKDSQ